MGRILEELDPDRAMVLKDIPMNTISSMDIEDVVNGRCVQSGNGSDIATTTISDDTLST